ncbi:glycosyltransferase family A protein [Bacteriovorax sp. PP10]|uniref:Glycosyltransferase family A protein n=1 Tax=Bacteriovorax antarcticus TaxID=3088717 RepID=A0ABU5VQU3_9BACT|nr:glycosyltransferase family A protein [Bacteriovorax sp. PP10]MEA9354992.1 glycosyltransferase family A protein [Bacteriovorax sp. PP10]
MNLTVVIPTHNRNLDVSHLLDSLLKQDLSGLLIEVLVIGNLYDPLLEKLVQSFGQKSHFPIKYFFAGRIGVNSARNIGIEKAESLKIYFLDDDVLIRSPQHLSTLYHLSIAHPNIAAIGGSYHLPEHTRLIDTIYHAICTSWLKEGNQKNGTNRFHLVGGNTLYNKELLEKRLHFNEQITFGGSETELNLKLHVAGDRYLFTDSLDIEHSTHLNIISLINKAIRQGMGRCFHEIIVPEIFWSADNHNPALFLKPTLVTRLDTFMAGFYFALYDFFFHVGYRHGKRQKNGQLSFIAILVCTFQTFFQINSDQVLYLPNSQAKSFHMQDSPALKFREIYHWVKANIWWKICYYLSPKTILHFLKHVGWMISHFIMKCFNFTVWRIVPIVGSIVICSITTFFPFNTIGLRVPYNNAFNALEDFLKRRY